VTPCQTIGHSELGEIRERDRVTPVSTFISQSGLRLRQMKVKTAGHDLLEDMRAAASRT
jgi:hypothetical protein